MERNDRYSSISRKSVSGTPASRAYGRNQYAQKIKARWVYLNIKLNREKNYGFAFEHDSSSYRRDDTIVVSKIIRDGPADVDGRLRVGDIIVTVDDKHFNKISHTDAIEVLKYAGPTMTMTVRRLEYFYVETNKTLRKSNKTSSESSNHCLKESQEKTGFLKLHVVLKKDPNGILGINIHGGCEENGKNKVESHIKISKLAPYGAACKNGRLKVGDIIVKVNSESFRGISCEDAVDILRQTESEVTITAARPVQKTQSSKRSQESKSSQQQENEVNEEEKIDANSPWIYLQIDLIRGSRKYGFCIAGGYDKPFYEGDNGIVVSKIIPDGVADLDGQLQIDDVIAWVNDINFEYVTNEFALETLKGMGPKMTLIVRRLKDEFKKDAHQQSEEFNQSQSNMDISYEKQSSPAPEKVNENKTFTNFEITITKRMTGGLGMNVQGGYDEVDPSQDSSVTISRIIPDGVVAEDGRLQIGDIILIVDDTSVNGMTREDVIKFLKNTGRQVTFSIGRYVENR